VPLARFHRRGLALAALGLALAGAATAESASDAERARVGVREGRFVPLASILDWIDRHYLGRAIEIELEDDESPPTYEVEWLTPQGNVVEFEFDARSGELLEREGRGLEEARRP
jgi:uncharacterized membrane protein YkoI